MSSSQPIILNEYHKKNYFMVLSELVDGNMDGKSFKIQKDGKKYIFRYRFRYLDLEDSGDMFMNEDIDLLLKQIKLKYKNKISNFYKYLLRILRNEDLTINYEIFGRNILEYIIGEKLENIKPEINEKLCKNINCRDIKYITPYHKHICRYCEEKFDDNIFNEHLKECIMRNVRCNECYWNGKYYAFQKHLCVNGSVNPTFIFT